jgi:hypothetical protein
MRAGTKQQQQEEQRTESKVSSLIIEIMHRRAQAGFIS